jgi:hypothetical protein
MALQFRLKHLGIAVSAALTISICSQALAAETFVASGPVAWAGTWDGNGQQSYYDGYYIATAIHKPDTEIYSNSYSDYGFVTFMSEWHDAIVGIDVTYYDPDGNVRFSESIVPKPNGTDPTDPYSYDLNWVSKYASDLTNYYGSNLGYSTQQYWYIDYSDQSTGFHNYAGLAYVDQYQTSPDLFNDFSSRMTEYPDPEEGPGWSGNQMSSYSSSGYSQGSGGYGGITSTETIRDSDGDGDGDGVLDADDACPDSALDANIVIGGTVTKVPNTLLDNGCSLSDLISFGISQDNKHGGNVSTVAQILNGLMKEGILSGKNKGALQSAMAKTNKKK